MGWANELIILNSLSTNNIEVEQTKWNIFWHPRSVCKVIESISIQLFLLYRKTASKTFSLFRKHPDLSTKNDIGWWYDWPVIQWPEHWENDDADFHTKHRHSENVANPTVLVRLSECAGREKPKISGNVPRCALLACQAISHPDLVFFYFSFSLFVLFSSNDQFLV